MAEEPHRPAPGTPIVLAFRKWDGAEHWHHDALYLGADAAGDWIGQPPGWRSARPGREIITGGPVVTLLPRDAPFTLTHNTAPPADHRVYIDLVWDMRWDDPRHPTGIDMDLDVIRDPDGVSYIDDRDEWDENRARWRYPQEVVAAVDACATRLLPRVAASDPPFDDATADRWRARLARVASGR